MEEKTGEEKTSSGTFTLTMTGDDLINLALRGVLPEKDITPCQHNSDSTRERRVSTGRSTNKSRRLLYNKQVKTVQICTVERDRFGQSYVGPVRKIRVGAGSYRAKSQPVNIYQYR